MNRLFAVCLLIPVAASAETLPALFGVTDVAGSDRLNIRQDPDATSPVIGELAHDANGIEVVALSDTQTWGQINSGERSGWVSMRFLRRAPETAIGPVPVPLRCFGTEPFWSLSVPDSGSLTLTVPDAPSVEMRLEAPATARGRSDKFGFRASSPDTEYAGTVTRALCSDGMSDQTFGLAIDLLAFPETGSDSGTGTLLSGCCSLAR